MRATIPATPRARSPLLAIALCLLIVLAGCGTSSSDDPTATSASATQPAATGAASTETATTTDGATTETPGAASVESPSGASSVATPAPATPAGPVHGPTPLPPPAASPVASPAPVVRANPVDAIPDTPEQWRATDLVAGQTGVYGYVVLDQDGTVVASINGTTPFITASTYKLILMADILWRVESGQFALDDTLPLTHDALGDWGDMYFSEVDLGTEHTIDEYLHAVGIWSSNAAARTLLSLTNVEMLRMTAELIGMTDTYLFAVPDELPIWPPPIGPDANPEEYEVAIEYLEDSAAETGSVNISTPLDMARYQLAVINDTLISPWVSQQVGDILAQQGLRDGFPHFLDGQYSSFSKPGNLPDAANDVGGIFLPNGARAVAMMSLAIPDPWWATLIQQRLALIATGETDIPPMPW